MPFSFGFAPYGKFKPATVKIGDLVHEVSKN
jgi:hypothetical protein